MDYFSKLEDVFRKNYRKLSLARIINRKVNSYVRNKNSAIVSYSAPDTKHVLDLVKKVRAEVDMLLNDAEACQLYFIAKAALVANGDFIEVGCYEGGSSKIICEAVADRNIFIFDTFNGLPSVGEHDDKFRVGQFRCPYEKVNAYLSNYNCKLIRGIFPESAYCEDIVEIAFAHIDVDTYESSLSCISWIYPRLSKGGILLSHDYGFAGGVTKAIDTYFGDKGVVIRLPGAQIAVIKV